jgi:2-isopropylmalate synthase
VTVGEDAQGEALLTVEHNGRTYRGAGISTNILEAAARAYLEVINRIEAAKASTDRSGEGRRIAPSIEHRQSREARSRCQ